MASPPRVLIADDHAIVRDGLRLIVTHLAECDVIGEAGSGREAVEIFRDRRPDLVLLDLRMPEGDGIDALRGILALDPEAKVLIITTYDTDEDIYRCLKTGAKGYILKDSPREIIAEAVAEILNGGTYAPAQVTRRFFARMKAPELTTREVEVLQQIAAGLANKEIADRLGIGIGTVKTHVQNVFEKLGALSRTQAVGIARDRGLLDER